MKDCQVSILEEFVEELKLKFKFNYTDKTEMMQKDGQVLGNFQYWHGRADEAKELMQSLETYLKDFIDKRN